MHRLFGVLVSVLLLGCVDGLQSRHPVVASPETLTTDDFVDAAAAIVQSMSGSPALNLEAPAKVQLGAVTNGTRLDIDTETLLARATVYLFKSGRVVQWDSLSEPNVKPDLLLRGRIYEVQGSGNKIRIKGCYLRLTLVELSTGAYIWSEERKVKKRVKAEVEG